MSPTILAKLLAFKRGMSLVDGNGIVSHRRWWSRDLVTLFKSDLAVERYFTNGQAERDNFFESLQWAPDGWR